MNKQLGPDSLIEHFSREIEVMTSNTMTFRIRIAFTVFIGPYILLASIIVGTKGNLTLNITSVWTWCAIAVASAMFFCLGVTSGRIEKQAWRQCEKWRRLIIKLANCPDEARPALYDAVNYTELGDNVEKSYKIVFGLILVSFFALGFVATNIFTVVGNG